MSYQIKSTPFFRRMVSTSKKNGELQKLKAEYERIKDFNDHTIEMKMRQVRLKRLFREIEEIKETTSKRRRRGGQDQRPKTMEEIRVETMVKAKELGQEYSKLNALMVDQTLSKVERSNSTITTQQEHDRRSLLFKSIHYGNAMSRRNMEKAIGEPKSKLSRRSIKVDKSIDSKLEQLRQRLEYGNSKSICNMIKVIPKEKKAKMRSQVTPDVAAPVTTGTIEVMELEVPQTAVISEPEEPTLKPEVIELAPDIDVRCYRMFDSVQNSPFDNIPMTIDPEIAKREKEQNKLRALQLWRKLRILVLFRFDKIPRRNQLPRNQTINAEEFRLRSSMNDTHLLQNYHIDRKRAPPMMSNRDTDTTDATDATDDSDLDSTSEQLISSENHVKNIARQFEQQWTLKDVKLNEEHPRMLGSIFNHLDRQLN